MIQKCQILIKQLDIYGQQVQFSFKGKQVYQTTFGGMASLLLLTIILSFFYNNIKEFVKMSKVESESHNSFNINPTKLELNTQNFMFAVQISQENFIENPFFNITVEQRHFRISPNGTQKFEQNKQIPLTQCTLEHFESIFIHQGINFKEEFQKLKLQNYLCPKIFNKSNLTYYIEGQETSENYQYLQFSVTACACNQDYFEDSDWKPTCKTELEIQQELNEKNGFKLQIVSTNYILNPKESENYISPYLATDLNYYFVPNQMLIQSDIYIRGISIQTDNGILMYPDLKNQNFVHRDEAEKTTQILINQKKQERHLIINLKRSPYSQIIYRSFQKLDQLLGQMGGFSQFLIVMVGIIVKIYNKQHYLISLANELYEFHQEQRKRNSTKRNMINMGTIKDNFRKAKQATRNIHVATLTDLHQSNQIIFIPQFQSANKIKISKSPIETQLNKFQKYLQKKNQITNNIKLILSLIFKFNCIASEDTLLIEKAIYDIEDNLDIISVIHREIEIKKLIKVLFNKQQQILFNVSHKPKINLMKKTKRRKAFMNSYYQNGNIDLVQKYHQLVDAYKLVLAQSAEAVTEEQIRFNERLTQLLGGDLIKILDSEIEQVQVQELNSFQDLD